MGLQNSKIVKDDMFKNALAVIDIEILSYFQRNTLVGFLPSSSIGQVSLMVQYVQENKVLWKMIRISESLHGIF